MVSDRLGCGFRSFIRGEPPTVSKNTQSPASHKLLSGSSSEASMLHLSPKPLQSLNEFTFFVSPKPLLWFQIGSAVVSDRLYKESLRRATHSEHETLKAQPVTSCHLVPAQRRPCWYGDDRKWAWATWIFLTALATAELVFQEGSASPPSFPPSRTQTCERRTPEC